MGRIVLLGGKTEYFWSLCGDSKGIMMHTEAGEDWPRVSRRRKMGRTVVETIGLARDAERVVNLHLARYVVGECGARDTCIALHVAARQMAAAVDLLPLSSLRWNAYRALSVRRTLMRGW